MRTELTLYVVWLAGMVLWFSGYAYSAEITGAALILIAFLYFPFGFYFFPVKQQHNLVFSVVAGSLLFMAPISLLFALLHFPTYRQQSGVGLCVLPILFLVTLLLFRSSPPPLRPYYRSHLLRVGAWLAVIIFLVFAPHFRMPTF